MKWYVCLLGAKVIWITECAHSESKDYSAGLYGKLPLNQSQERTGKQSQAIIVKFGVLREHIL